MGPVRWPSSRCDEVRGVRKLMGSYLYLSELLTGHEPGRVGRARSPSAPMRECGALGEVALPIEDRGSWEAATDRSSRIETMNGAGGPVATDRDVSSRRMGVDWKQGKVMRAETARAPEWRPTGSSHGWAEFSFAVPWGSPALDLLCRTMVVVGPGRHR